jgi:hypothetical protein
MGDAQQFIGRWRLTSWTAVHDDGRMEYRPPFGDRQQGVVMFGSDGWVAVQIAATARPTMSGPDPFSAPESEQAKAFATYLAYVASYEVRQDDLQLKIDLSLYPQWVGAAQVRQYRFDDGELILRPPPVETAGQHSTHELRWRRES